MMTQCRFPTPYLCVFSVFHSLNKYIINGQSKFDFDVVFCTSINVKIYTKQAHLHPITNPDSPPPRMNKAKSVPATTSAHYPSQQSIDMNPYIDQQFIFQPQMGPNIPTNIQDPTVSVPDLPQGPPPTGAARRRSPHRGSPLNGPMPPPQHGNNFTYSTSYSQRTVSPHRTNSVHHASNTNNASSRGSRTNSNARSIHSQNSPQLRPLIPNQQLINAQHPMSPIQPPSIIVNQGQMMVQPPNMNQMQNYSIPKQVAVVHSQPRRPSRNTRPAPTQRERSRSPNKKPKNRGRSSQNQGQSQPTPQPKIGKVKFAPRKSVSKQLKKMINDGSGVPRRASTRSKKDKSGHGQLVNRTSNKRKSNSTMNNRTLKKRNSKSTLSSHQQKQHSAQLPLNYNQPRHHNQRVPSHGHSQQNLQQRQHHQPQIQVYTHNNSQLNNQQKNNQNSPVIQMNGFTLTDAMYD